MPVAALDHFNIRTPRLEETKRFFADVIGLREGPRPPFSFPGAWMYAGDSPVVHLTGIESSEDLMQPPDGYAPRAGVTGAVDHLAFAATDLEGMKQRLEAAGLEYMERTVPGFGQRQLFVADPNGVTIELNFAAPESRRA